MLQRLTSNSLSSRMQYTWVSATTKYTASTLSAQDRRFSWRSRRLSVWTKQSWLFRPASTYRVRSYPSTVQSATIWQQLIRVSIGITSCTANSASSPRRWSSTWFHNTKYRHTSRRINYQLAVCSSVRIVRRGCRWMNSIRQTSLSSTSAVNVGVPSASNMTHTPTYVSATVVNVSSRPSSTNASSWRYV